MAELFWLLLFSTCIRAQAQQVVHGFEGQKVKLTGILDSKLNQIHVLKIELESNQ